MINQLLKRGSRFTVTNKFEFPVSRFGFPPSFDKPVKPFLIRISANGYRSVAIERRLFLLWCPVRNNNHIWKTAPILPVFFRKYDKAVVVSGITQILPAHELVGNSPKPFSSVLKTLKPGKMHFQDFCAAVFYFMEEGNLVAEHRDNDISFFFL